jgi:hypothetical protein
MGCDCNEGPITVGPAHIYTARSETYSPVWLTSVVSGSNYTKLVVRYYVAAISGNMKIQLAYSYGGSPMEQTVVCDGVEVDVTGWQEDYLDDLEPGQFYQFGLAVKNDGDTANCESAFISSITFLPTTC